MNYFHIDDNGSLEFKLGPLYFSSYSQVEYNENLDYGNLGFSQGFCDIYLDLPGFGLFHAGLGTGLGGNCVFERFDCNFLEN